MCIKHQKNLQPYELFLLIGHLQHIKYELEALGPLFLEGLVKIFKRTEAMWRHFIRRKRLATLNRGFLSACYLHTLYIQLYYTLPLAD